MFNAIQFYKDYRIQYWTSGNNVSPGWINIQCPFCGDVSNHLGYNQQGDYYHCWKCGRHKTERVLMILLNIPVTMAKSMMKEYEMESRSFQPIKRKSKATSLILPGSKKLNKFHREYLHKRNFDPDEIITEYEIQATGPTEKWNEIDYRLRIIIPIFFKRKLVSFQGRDITDQQKERYKGCPIEKSIVNYKDILYGYDRAFLRAFMTKQNRVVVVEGIFDVWRMGDGFVASFGTTMTSAQIRILSSWKEVTFLFDSEKSAQDKAKEYAKMLASLGIQAGTACLDKGFKDPAELTPAEALEVRKFLLEE